MVTKKELQDTWTKERAEAQKKLDNLNEAVKFFSDEVKNRDYWRGQYKNYSQKKDALMEHCFDGSFGDEHNYKFSIIPENIETALRDAGIDVVENKRLIINSLASLMQEKVNEIRNSDEYVRFDKYQDESYQNECKATSPEHDEMIRKIEDLIRLISWLDEKLNKIEHKGELIKIAKELKENETKRKQIANDEEFMLRIKKIIVGDAE